MRSLIFIASACLMLLIGCATIPSASKVVDSGIYSTPSSLTGVAKSLTPLIIVGVIAAAAGAALFFFVPAVPHTLSLAVFGGGLSLEISSLVLKVSLWIIPWVAGALGLASVALFVYELYINRAVLETPIVPPVAPKAAVASPTLPITPTPPPATSVGGAAQGHS